jgi:ferredoxin
VREWELAVDGQACMGHGRCYSAIPDMLADDEEGYVTLRGSSMQVPADRLDDARLIVASCPEQAISLHELNGD